MIKIRRGLDLPITGKPAQVITKVKNTKQVALVGPNYIGMKPTMLVKEGDEVKIGQPVFNCKKIEGVVYTSPAAGKVVSLNRGDKRVFQSLVIEVAQNETHHNFSNFSKKNIEELAREDVQNLLVESGLWTALRTRPYSKIPAVGSEPESLFLTVSDTNPLAMDSQVAVSKNSADFTAGVLALSKLTSGKTFVCKMKDTTLPELSGEGVEVHEFAGPHPAGNAGTHIHFLNPVSANKMVWTISTQDIIAVGRLFLTGKLMTERLISLAGPNVVSPTLIETRLGADINEIVEGELTEGTHRVISGSVLNGDKVDDTFHFLGRYHNQVSVIEEDKSREFLGWQGPGWNKFSILETFASHIIPGKLFPFTSTTHGSKRAMVPVGIFEKIMPLDILPTQLLRALWTDDMDLAQQLGCLELDEEDLALCTFASPGKQDFGPILRKNLTTIEKEG